MQTKRTRSQVGTGLVFLYIKEIAAMSGFPVFVVKK